MDSSLNQAGRGRGSLHSGKTMKFPGDIWSIEKRLEKSFSEDNIVNENRTHRKKDGIRTRERLYSQGLVETVTNWEKSDIKQRTVSDLLERFHFSHTIKGNSIESKIITYDDIYMEDSRNYDTDSAILKYRGKNNFAVHYSLPSKNGNKIKCNTLNAENCSRIMIDFGDGRTYFEVNEASGEKKARRTNFHDGSVQIEYKTPEIERKTVMDKNGGVIDISNNPEREEERISRESGKGMLCYSKKYADGTLNKCCYDGNKVKQTVLYPGGNSYDLSILPGGVMKKDYNHQDGTKESVTFFEDGKNVRTVRYTDNSLLSEHSYPDDSYKLGMKYSDGTVYLCKGWNNGVSQQCFCWPENGMVRLVTEFEKDNMVERKTIYNNGSCVTEIESEKGKSQTVSSETSLLKNALDKITSSPADMDKFLENPFRDPLLTEDLQLWVHILMKAK